MAARLGRLGAQRQANVNLEGGLKADMASLMKAALDSKAGEELAAQLAEMAGTDS